jgi:hypothetical protein
VRTVAVVAAAAACAINCANDQRYLIDAAAGISWNGGQQSQMLAI